ncbi:FCSD flavin-binding domain-containing protein [Accumulibacter sp.]|uniref:FCSD flavin-binding domain-containing protein n=1 Tax=Accumulibacter sp. TaxID=2053492 RepID=UPI002631FE1A|nr:FCSD flavin-binding domain-containing protein [Accumulibacter sp.]
MTYKVEAQPGLSRDDVITSMKQRVSKIDLKLIGAHLVHKEVEAIAGQPTPKVEIYRFSDALLARELRDCSPESAIFPPCHIAVVEDAQQNIWLSKRDWDVSLSNAAPNRRKLPDRLYQAASRLRKEVMNDRRKLTALTTTARLARFLGNPRVAGAGGRNFNVFNARSPKSAYAALRLSAPGESAEIVKMTPIERDKQFISCHASNEVLGGNRPNDSPVQGCDGLTRTWGIRLVNASVTGIDADRRRIRTDSAGDFECDRLVLSPGFDFIHGGIEGYDAKALMPNTCHSLVDEKRAIHVCPVHRDDSENNRPLVAEGSGGVPKEVSVEQGSPYTRAWATTIWKNNLS